MTRRWPGDVPDQPTLVEFLRARLQEDEWHARQASDENYSPRWITSDEAADLYGDDRYRHEQDGVWAVLSDEAPLLVFPFGGGEWTSAHVVRHDPARVLAEVEAKRRIVGRQQQIIGSIEADDEPTLANGGANFQALRDAGAVLRLLALPYADHHDYRQEWRPAP